jgi:hypothetical protein
MLNKIMSFLKITDPAKRDLLVQELIKTRRNIMQDSIDERVGEITAQQSLSKLFKPLTEKIETTTKAIKEMPAITLPQQPVPPLAALAPPLAADESASELVRGRHRSQQAVNSRPNLVR